MSLQAPGLAVVAQDRGQTMGGKSMRNWNSLVKMNTQQLAKQEEELQPCSRDLMGPTPYSHPIHPPISQEQPRYSWALAGLKNSNISGPRLWSNRRPGLCPGAGQKTLGQL